MSSSIRLPPLPKFSGKRIDFPDFYTAICDSATVATTIRGLMLFIILPPAEFALTQWAPVPPAVMAEPVDPGPMPDPPAAADFNAWKYQKDVYNCYCQEYSNFQNVILAALPEETHILLSAVVPLYGQTIVQIMNGLRDNYEVMTPTDLDLVRSKLFVPYDPTATTINDFIASHIKAHTLLAANRRLIADADKICYLKDTLIPCGLYAPCFITYDAIHPTAATQTFANFSVLIRNFQVSSMVMAAHMGFTYPHLNMANASQRTVLRSNSADDRRDNKNIKGGGGQGGGGQRINAQFCWTHGFGSHSSHACNKPAEGHVKDATWKNPKESPAFFKFIQKSVGKRSNNNRSNNNRYAAAGTIATLPPLNDGDIQDTE